MTSKPIASVSLDLDNEWTYLKVHGDPAWESFPSYLDIVVPRVLAFLKARNLTITFFVVGQDAALEKNRAALRALAEAGHEIGNHSFAHEPWLHLYSEQQVDEELARTEELLLAVTGERPFGFRGPGFSVSKTVLGVLKKRGYQYDASTFPTFLGPLARAYYFMTARLSAEERKQRKLLFGSLAEGLRPLKPYHWDLSGEALIEIPVTTLPILKIPIHVSYLQYLASFSEVLAEGYWSMAMRLCLATGVGPSLLLHPLDFLGSEDVSTLSFFPAMKVPRERKLARVGSYLEVMARRFEILPMRAHADSVMASGGARRVEPRFRGE